MIFFTSEKSFTLIELVIVIGILAILATAVILVLNPSELLKQSRDTRRLSDLASINSALGLYQSDGGSSFGTSSVVYVSLPDSSPTCNNLGLPTLPSDWSYSCSNSTNYRKVDGNGWLPVNFISISFGSPLDTLPIDPVNTTSTGNYYTYVSGGSWKLTSLFESEKYAKNMNKDGGPDVGLYETGTNLSLASFQRGLIGYWKFDEGSGTTAGDSIGYGNNGTLVGGVTVNQSGKVGAAMQFDGSSGYVTLPGTISNQTSAGAVALWVYATAKGGYFTRQTGSGWVDERLAIYQTNSDSKLYGVLANGVSHAIFSTNSDFTLNQWNHIVMTWNSNVWYFYLNGGLDKTGTLGGLTPDMTGTANWIGRTYGLYINWATGKIDDVRIYNRALSAAEISAIYNATK